MSWDGLSILGRVSNRGYGGAEFELKDKTLIIHMKEDLDHHNAIPIREQADKRMLAGNVKNIVFDFSKVGFMDSSGIGVVLGRYKRLKLMGGGKVAVTGVNACVNRIFSMAGMYNLIQKYNSLSDALKQYSK